MYSTCLYCTRDLDTNEVLEDLPIGRRVAFDAAQGRLWVVCRRCAKWNLVPFDSRLEAIDACERLYRETATRYATDNIGIARVREGLELVRIGAPLRPEFAAWRYGDSFGKRRRRTILIAASIGTVGIAALSGAAALGIGLGGIYQLPNMFNLIHQQRRVVVRVPREGERPLELSPQLCGSARLVEAPEVESGWGIQTQLMEKGKQGAKYRSPGKTKHLITGPEAERLLAGILGRTNQWIGTTRQVGDAVRQVEAVGDLGRLIQEGVSPAKTRGWSSKGMSSRVPTWRLATEMALHEESERVALAGELKLLAWQWREAERLARISDDLAFPEGVDGQLDDVRRADADADDGAGAT